MTAGLPHDVHALDDFLAQELAWLDNRVADAANKRRELLERHREAVRQRVQALEGLKDAEGADRGRKLLEQIEAELAVVASAPRPAVSIPVPGVAEPETNKSDAGANGHAASAPLGPVSEPRPKPQLAPTPPKPEPTVNVNEVDYRSRFAVEHADIDVPRLEVPIPSDWVMNSRNALVMQLREMISAADDLLLGRLDKLPEGVRRWEVQILAAMGRLLQESNPHILQRDSELTEEVRRYFGRLTKLTPSVGAYIVGLKASHHENWIDKLIEALSERHDAWVRWTLDRLEAAAAVDRQKEADALLEKWTSIIKRARVDHEAGKPVDMEHILSGVRVLTRANADLTRLMPDLAVWQEHFSGNDFRGLRRKLARFQGRGDLTVKVGDQDVSADLMTRVARDTDWQREQAEAGPAEQRLYRTLHDRAVLIAGETRTDEEIEKLRQFFGLDELVWITPERRDRKGWLERVGTGYFDAVILFVVSVDHDLAQQLRNLSKTSNTPVKNIKRGMGRRVIAEALEELLPLAARAAE